MNIQNLQQAVHALEKNQGIIERKKAKFSRATFGKWMHDQPYYQNLSDEKKNQIQADVDLWYAPDAVALRGYEYAEKVFADKKEQTNLIDARATANETVENFAKIFGLSNWQLPKFQRDTLEIMCALHLGVHPKETSMNLNRGCFLAGAPQIGKTSVFMYLKTLPDFSFRVVTGYQLQSLAEQYGQKGVEEYGIKGKNLVIDEIGWEKPAKHFGTEIDAVADVVHKRNQYGLMTHYTSNMSIEKLKERYQPHIIARIMKGCNVIEATGAEQHL